MCFVFRFTLVVSLYFQSYLSGILDGFISYSSITWRCCLASRALFSVLATLSLAGPFIFAFSAKQPLFSCCFYCELFKPCTNNCALSFSIFMELSDETKYYALYSHVYAQGFVIGAF